MRTIVDYRLGGKPRYFIGGRPDINMRLPDEVQKCVVFLGRKELDRKTRTERIVYGGTAFFVEVPTLYGASLIYLVTARHVAEKIEHGEFFIRANTHDGGSEVISVDAGVEQTWFYHPTDDSADVAVLPWCPPDSVDFKCIPHHIFLDPEKIQRKGIGVGDEVYATGLFRMVEGSKRNLPIVRTGNIAMLPSERVPLSNWRAPTIEAYLIEARSIGGLSGSPVFAQRSIEVQATEHTGRKPLAAGAVFFLGLIHGHWDISENGIDSSWDDTWRRGDMINVGVAMVVPAHVVAEAINHPDLRQKALEAVGELERRNPNVFDGGSPNTVAKGKEREVTRAVTEAVSATSTERMFQPKADSAFSEEQEPPTTDENPRHREDFNRLLTSVVKGKRSDD